MFTNQLEQLRDEIDDLEGQIAQLEKQERHSQLPRSQIDEQEEDKGQRLVMSVPEAGALLGCSRNKSYRLAQEGVLPTLKIQGRLVVPKERFLRWLNGEGGSDEDN